MPEEPHKINEDLDDINQEEDWPSFDIKSRPDYPGLKKNGRRITKVVILLLFLALVVAGIFYYFDVPEKVEQVPVAVFTPPQVLTPPAESPVESEVEGTLESSVEVPGLSFAPSSEDLLEVRDETPRQDPVTPEGLNNEDASSPSSSESLESVFSPGPEESAVELPVTDSPEGTLNTAKEPAEAGSLQVVSEETAKTDSGNFDKSASIENPVVSEKPAITEKPVVAEKPSVTENPVVDKRPVAGETVEKVEGTTGSNNATVIPDKSSGNADENTLATVWVANLSSTTEQAESEAVWKKLQAQQSRGTLYRYEATVDGKVQYRIRIGFYRNRTEAEEVGRALAEALKLNYAPWVVQPNMAEVKKYSNQTLSSLWVINLSSTPDTNESEEIWKLLNGEPVKKIQSALDRERVVAKQKGLSLYRYETNVNGQKQYRIRLGFFETQTEAEVAGVALTTAASLSETRIGKPWAVRPTIEEELEH